MNKLIKSIFCIFITTIIFTSCISTKKINKSDNQNQNQKKQEKQLINLSYKMIEFSEHFDYLETKIKYPEFENFPFLNKHIKNTIFSNYENFKNFSKSSWTEISELNSKTLYPPFEFILESDIFISNNLISILLRDYIYSGGAHGNTNLKSFNYDTETEKFLSIIDVTKSTYDKIARECRVQLENNLINNNEIISTPAEVDQMHIMINEGTFPQAGNFETFTVEKNIVTIYFEPYSVAPYSYGIQKVKIKN